MLYRLLQVTTLLTAATAPMAAAAAVCRAPQSCTNLQAPILPSGGDARIIGIAANEVINFTFPASPSNSPPPATPQSFCNVSITLTHAGANDIVYITLWLPLNKLKDAWNGRYLANGGGGLAAGLGEASLVTPLGQGYATSFTDGGLTLNNTIDAQSGAWALNADGSRNRALIDNLSFRSVHDMAVVSKHLIRQYYGHKARYSYYAGCSQGGRQGYASVARYPDDFDGVMANAPAVSGPRFVLTNLWPVIVMQNAEIPPFCVFNTYQRDIVAKCDGLDTAVDGLVSDWRQVDKGCDYDPKQLVGTAISCTEGNTTSSVVITSVYAEVVRSILDGPRGANGDFLWYGLAPGASFGSIASSTVRPDGKRTLIPYPPTVAYSKYLVFRNSSYDILKMSYADFYQAWSISINELEAILGDQTLNDLSGFKKAGGKLLTWVGLADESIPPSGLFRFREDVNKQLGGTDKVDDFYRIFMAPGVGHCGGGTGPGPVDPLAALIDWVEKGTKPVTIPAKAARKDGTVLTRNLCRFPKQFVYKSGDVNLASSFECR